MLHFIAHEGLCYTPQWLLQQPRQATRAMTRSSRFPIWPLVCRLYSASLYSTALFSASLVLGAAGALALAWWDWAYPGQIVAWWNREHVYSYYWRQLGWAAAVSALICLTLWLLSARARSAAAQVPAGHGLARAARPFVAAYLGLASLARYVLHPLGVQPGSSVWTYGLLMITSFVLALPLASLIRPATHAVHRAVVATGSPTRSGRCMRYILYGLVVLYVLAFGFLSVARHTSFRSHALDLGTMDQAMWNTAHGRLLERTPLYRPPAQGTRYESRLLDAKLELILVPLAALYRLWADPRLLLVIQTLALAAGVIPLYALIDEGCAQAQRSPGQDGTAGLAVVPLFIAAAYLLYLPLHYVNMADFHTSALMVLPLVAAWRSMTRRRWGSYYVWLGIALICRIDAAFAILMLGAVVAVSQKGQRRHGLYTLALAAAWLVVDFSLVVPVVQHVYGSGAGNLVARRFGMMGSSVGEALHTVLTRPGLVLSQLTGREKLQPVVELLAPLGFGPLISPLAFLPALPVLVINLLAQSVWQNSIHAHYMAPVIPFLWIALGEGLVSLTHRGRQRWAITLAVFVLINTFLVSLALSPFPPGKDFRLAEFYQPSSYVQNLRAVVALVPDGASLCAQSDLLPHLSQRRDVSLFPHCRLNEEEMPEYLVLDLDSTSSKSPLGYHAYYELVNAWLAQEDYGVIAQQGGALLLRHGASRRNLPAVLQALDAYGREFYRVDWLQARIPTRLRASELYRIPIRLRNTGSQCWQSPNQLPVRLAYRWWTADGALSGVDALRTDMPHHVDPGHAVSLRAWLLTPVEPGRYTLEWDLVREGDAWFSDMGGMVLRQAVTVE